MSILVAVWLLVTGACLVPVVRELASRLPCWHRREAFVENGLVLSWRCLGCGRRRLITVGWAYVRTPARRTRKAAT